MLPPPFPPAHTLQLASWPSVPAAAGLPLEAGGAHHRKRQCPVQASPACDGEQLSDHNSASTIPLMLPVPESMSRRCCGQPMLDQPRCGLPPSKCACKGHFVVHVTCCGSVLLHKASASKDNAALEVVRLLDGGTAE